MGFILESECDASERLYFDRVANVYTEDRIVLIDYYLTPQRQH